VVNKAQLIRIENKFKATRIYLSIQFKKCYKLVYFPEHFKLRGKLFGIRRCSPINYFSYARLRKVTRPFADADADDDDNDVRTTSSSKT
jgi:hypothetical protein